MSSLYTPVHCSLIITDSSVLCFEENIHGEVLLKINSLKLSFKKVSYQFISLITLTLAFPFFNPPASFICDMTYDITFKYLNIDISNQIYHHYIIRQRVAGIFLVSMFHYPRSLHDLFLRLHVLHQTPGCTHTNTVDMGQCRQGNNSVRVAK